MKRIFFAMLVACAALTSYAQGYAELIKANPAMAASNLMNYHFEKSVYTPAPKGYEEFYISHYGRHGSRYDASDANMTAIWPVMKLADSLGILTEVGKEFYKEFNEVMLEQDGMIGMLTGLGAKEHRGIAERMAANFPKVFKGKDGKNMIFCQSSTVPRCIMSMTNFVHSLSHNTKGLEYVFVTGDKYYDQLAYHDPVRMGSKIASAKEDSLRRAVMKPMNIVSYFFSDVEKAQQIIGDPFDFEKRLYLACSVGHLSDYGTCLLKYFPEDILISNWEARNARFFTAYGMAKETAQYQMEVSRRITQDFLKRAQKAVDEGNNVAADFRFGHDTGLMPFAGYIGVDGFEGRPSFADVNSVINTSVSMCMGSNIQFVFYRNKQGDVLVKILFNEKETKINGLSPISGPYYKWSDLKAHLISLI